MKMPGNNYASGILSTRKFWVVGLSVVLAGASLAYWFSMQSRARLVQAIPAPSDLASMEPQLKSYLEVAIRDLAKDVTDPRAQSRTGIIFAANQLWPQSLIAFQNASRLNSKDPLPLLYQGIAHENMGNLDEALGIFLSATQRFPKFPQGFCHLGEIAVRAGQTQLAAESFRSLIQLNPSEWRGFAGLAHAELLMNRPSDALENLKKAARIEPRSMVIHHLLGLAYKGLGRMEEAEIHLKKGIDGLSFSMPDPWSDEATTHMRLPQDMSEAARLAMQQGRPQDAASLLASALGYRPYSVSLMVHLAEALVAMGNSTKALELLGQAATLEPTNHKLLIVTASALVEANRPKEAIEWALRAIQQLPDTAPPHLIHSLALRELGQYDQALNSLLRAKQADPRNLLIQVEVGELLWKQLQQPDRALHEFQSVLTRDPDQPEALSRVAELAQEMGNQTLADSAREKLRQLGLLAPTQ